MTDCNKVIKDIEYAKDLLQNRPEQDTVDYKVYEVLDDALDLINDLRSQIAMLVGAQHELCEMLEEQEEPVDIEIEGGDSTWWHVCGECNGAVDNNDRFCRHCGRPFKQKKGGCNGCTYKGGEDCPLNYMTDGNFFCPNGTLE